MQAILDEKMDIAGMVALAKEWHKKVGVLAGLGAGSAGGSASGLGLGFFLALAAFFAAAAANGSLRKHERHTTDASPPETSPFPLVFHPHTPHPTQPRSAPPGEHHLCRAQKPVHQVGGHVAHPPPKRGVPHAAFAAAAASPSPPSPIHGGVPGPTMSCCSIRRTCTCPRGAFGACWVWGGGGVLGGGGGGALLGRSCGG